MMIFRTWLYSLSPHYKDKAVPSLRWWHWINPSAKCLSMQARTRHSGSAKDNPTSQCTIIHRLCPRCWTTASSTPTCTITIYGIMRSTMKRLYLSKINNSWISNRVIPRCKPTKSQKKMADSKCLARWILTSPMATIRRFEDIEKSDNYIGLRWWRYYNRIIIMFNIYY